MHDLPTGTVTLLFSDMEGSTGLLMRLGSDYSQVLDGIRRIQRAAWTAWGGTELGTEGDSFYVVFPSAPEAVNAAVQAQRGLAMHTWPRGEQVRVRMGIHTGNPTPHDGLYVGKDVHRAARIAAAAHGGQIVVSEVTAELVREDLPPGVDLRNLGSHQLKDIPRPERLFQLTVDGLDASFPPLKTIGAGSNLPVPPDEVVGRDKELEELTGALSWSRTRLLTLIGPGGAGKTRLAIELAHQLVGEFPDGAYFVPLASVTTSDVLWTTLAEVLELRLPDRDAPMLVSHLANRQVLLVLDNLEQLDGADAVVAELLARAPGLTVIATSRRPLHLSAEREYAVVPLELPDDTSLEAADRSAAVQLFVQLAQRVRPSFALTPDNAADVAALCQRLDGLPLALELAAARTKLLSPHALLARLDQALDLSAAGTQGPGRQRTLRQAIAWSEDLLTAELRRFFHQMGVFSGGADLTAIATVALPEDGNEVDTLDLVTDLVDASLLTVGETEDGEPRIDMLRTVQIYARECLLAGGGYDAVRERHADHYVGLAEQMATELVGGRRLQARRRFDLEHDNLRGALDWCFGDRGQLAEWERVRTGLRMCLAMNDFWMANGYLSEAGRWLDRAVRGAGDRDSIELARCKSVLARKLRVTGEVGRAYELALSGLDMGRRLVHGTPAVLLALHTLAALDGDRENLTQARTRYEEAISLARQLGDRLALFGCLADYAGMETAARHYTRSLEIGEEALGVAEGLGHTVGALITQHNIGWTLLEMDRVEEAADQMRRVIDQTLDFDEPAMLLPQALDFTVVLDRLGEHEYAVLLLGATDAGYDGLGIPPDPAQRDDRTMLIARTKAVLTEDDWEMTYQAGRRTPIEDALHAVADLPG